MQIYIIHSKYFDYKNELYIPIRSSSLNQTHTIIFPHETDKFIVSKDIIKNSDTIIAEVSYQSIGEGIELGWANFFQKPIICIYKSGSKISNSLKTISNIFIEYKDKEEMLTKIATIIK